MSGGRRPPRWVGPFLAALERTGEVREAANWAGVDFTSAYARRKVHADFAEDWAAALERFREGRAQADAGAVRALAKFEEGRSAPSTIPDQVRDGPPPPMGEEFEELSPASAAPSPTSPASGIGHSQVKRVSSERWSEAKERRFFDELVASANVRRSAAAAGVSVQAVYARRAKRPAFALRWARAIEVGRAAIATHLVAQAQRSLDPEPIDLPSGEPRVSISEAIKIAQMNQAGGSGGRGRGGSGGGGHFPSFEEQAAEMSEEAVAELRARILRKLDRLRDRMIREEGWSHDPETDSVIPPGWVRAQE